MADIDWNAVWRRRLKRRQDASARPCAEIWQGKESALRYWEASRGDSDPWRCRAIDDLGLEKGFRVLDIGAGPGSMAIPMARRVARVTAVEPARGMADVLEEKCRAERIENVRCVRKTWEAVDIETDLDGPYHLVLAAFSLAMADLAGAIEKMIRVADGTVALFWFAGATAGESLYREIWPRIHGRPYEAGPKADVVFNLLYQMGIYPEMTVFPFRSVTCFDDFNAAEAEFRHRLSIDPEGPAAPLQDFLRSRLRPEGTGLALHQEATCVKFWWHTGS